GQPVTFSATLTAQLPSTAVPTGSVEFFDDTTSLGTATLDGSGVATLPSISNLAVGSHPIKVAYTNTDGNFNSISMAQSPLLNFVVTGNTISGKLLDTSGNPISGKTIGLGINNGSAVTMTTDGSGNYSFTNQTYTSGNVIVVFVSGDANTKGETVTRAGAGDITGLNITQNAITARHDDAGPITNTDLFFVNSYPDAITVSNPGGNSAQIGDASTNTLIIAGGSTYAPGGGVLTGNLTN